MNTNINGSVHHNYNLVQIIPYVLVLMGGIICWNVFLVLLTGIVSGAFIMLVTGQTCAVELVTNMGNGGFDALLHGIHHVFKGKRCGQLGMGILVGAMDIATANNTVAIVMANPIAKEMAQTYEITPKKTASLLDTFSCITQGILPYGAQMLVAISAVTELGKSISAFDIIPYMFYPFFLLVSSLIWIGVKR